MRKLLFTGIVVLSFIHNIYQGMLFAQSEYLAGKKMTFTDGNNTGALLNKLGWLTGAWQG